MEKEIEELELYQPEDEYVEYQNDMQSQFKKDLGEKGGVFIWQKYMGLRLIDAMQSASKKAASLVATEMLRYAASNTDISTYFIKIK